MIIALISIGFLVYLLSSLYFANAKNKDFANAEATLKRISEIIANAENEQEDVSDPAPVGWILGAGELVASVQAKSVTVRFDAGKVSLEELVAAVNGTGFRAHMPPKEG